MKNYLTPEEHAEAERLRAALDEAKRGHDVNAILAAYLELAGYLILTLDLPPDGRA